MSDQIAAAVLAAERERCGAMLSNNIAALDALLDPRLSFSHATGAIDDKPAYMAKLAAGRIDYRAIVWREELVIALSADAALLTGRMTSRVAVESVEKELDNRVLSAWARDDGVWRVVAFQSTPLRV